MTSGGACTNDLDNGPMTRRTRGYIGGALVGLLVFVVCPLTQAAAAVDDEKNNNRPRIGLVLGGGGAKGAAHIGVLRVLDELRIPVDCVAGTSMGALVGGTFAYGMPAEEIERATAAIDWSSTLGKKGLRDRTPIERKLEGTTYTNQLEWVP